MPSAPCTGPATRLTSAAICTSTVVRSITVATRRVPALHIHLVLLVTVLAPLLATALLSSTPYYKFDRKLLRGLRHIYLLLRDLYVRRKIWSYPYKTQQCPQATVTNPTTFSWTTRGTFVLNIGHTKPTSRLRSSLQGFSSAPVGKSLELRQNALGSDLHTENEQKHRKHRGESCVQRRVGWLSAVPKRSENIKML